MQISKVKSVSDMTSNLKATDQDIEIAIHKKFDASLSWLNFI